MTTSSLLAVPSGAEFNALVIGSTGGIGHALISQLSGMPSCKTAIGLSRSSQPAINFDQAETLTDAANQIRDDIGELNLLFIATGTLTAPDGSPPEKSFSQLSDAAMTDVFRINTLGPAMALKAFLPLMARRGLCRIGVLSARVGSIGDNQLGGWISYRASKAALNQIVHTAAIEMARRNKDSVCVALHPGTIETDLSRPYANDHFTHSAEQCSANLLNVLGRLTPEQSGGFFDYAGKEIVW